MRFDFFLNNFNLENQKISNSKKKYNILRIDNLNNNIVFFKILKSTNKKFNCKLKLKKNSIIKFRKNLIINKRDIENYLI